MSENEQKAAERELDANRLYTEFENTTAFLDTLNLRRDIARCINFNQGVQWNLDQDVEDFPKIVLNMLKQIGKVRKSGILQNEYGYLVNSSNFKSIRKIQDFLKYLSRRPSVNLQIKDLKVINDTYTKGTGICYFYWNAEQHDFLSKSGGKLKAEVIDIRRFRVADAYIQDLQEQEWVAYVTRERLDSIKLKYGKDVEADAEIYTNSTEKPIINEDVTKDFANVYVKFYRNYEGQVFFVIFTQRAILKEPTPLNPNYDKKKYQERKPVSAEAPNTTSLPDGYKESKKERAAQEVFGMYPFASLVLDERDNCFYGIPGAYENIETQISINHHFSVYDKGLQDNVLGGFVMRQGVLEGQEITTENGQQLELDLKPGEKISDVFGRMPVNAIPNDSLNFSVNLMSVLRQVTGASNIQIGQADYAGQSGKQTQALLERAKENSSDVALLFNEYKRQQALIMFLFAKFFYDNEDFQVIEHGIKKDTVRVYMGRENDGEDKKFPEYAGTKFDGTDYIGDDVMIDIRVGAAPSFSEYSNIEIAGLAMQSGQIPFEVYVNMLPDGMVSNRDELLELMQNNSAKVIQGLSDKIKQYENIMKMMSDQYNKTQKDIQNIDVVVGENTRLKSLIADLAAKGIEITQDATAQNLELTQDIKDLLKSIPGTKKE